MQSLESIFVREFRNSVKITTGYKDIYKIPLPDEVKDWKVSGTELYAVRGIEKEYYTLLNKTIVKRLPKDKVAKRRTINKVTRAFATDEEGNYIYEDYKVPSGSVVILSDKKIGVPYTDYVKPNEGYGYIDFVYTEEGIQYMYVLPKSVLYKVNQTALAISVTNMKNYSGMGYTTWDSGVIYIHVIPYNPNSKYTGTKILKTSYSLDYKEDIATILKYWETSYIIPVVSLCCLADGSNMALKPTITGYEEYIPVESLPLGDKEIYEGGIQ